MRLGKGSREITGFNRVSLGCWVTVLRNKALMSPLLPTAPWPAHFPGPVGLMAP